MKIWNLNASMGADGGKIVDVQIHGVIDGGWLDDSSVSTAEIAQALAEHQDAKKINVHINSVGGSLFGGVALYNILNAHPGEVTSYVDGLAASAASVIAMAGKTVMGRGAMLMVHNPLAMAYGDAADLRRTAAVLDKARDSLLSIYKAKTGKDGQALKAMLDAETWMGADQALRQGFANEIADGADQVVADLGEEVIFNAATFPRSVMPAQILALAVPKTALPDPPGGVDLTPQDPPKEEPEMEFSREVLAAKAPDLLKALLDEGKAAGIEEGKQAGVAAERARLREIDDLGLKGCDDLVAAAKYEQPIDARDLAVAAIKAGKQAGADLLEARRQESAVAASVRQSTPDKNSADLEKQAAANIARLANERRGGSR